MPPRKDPIQAFYEKYPYPEPIQEVPATFFDGRAALEGCPSLFFHVYWPRRAVRDDLDILLAGCGTSIAAHYAAASPRARFTAIDLSTESLAHSTRLCERYGIANVEHRNLAIEHVRELGLTFDLIINSGVLMLTAEPETTLRAMRDVLRVDGSLFLVVYGKYGRAGLYMIQELLQRAGISPTETDDRDIEAIRELVESLPAEHPLHPFRRRLGRELASRSGVADLFLNPRDRAYSVPDMYALLARCDLAVQEWVYRACYEPSCMGLGNSSLVSERAERLPVGERYAIGELYGGQIDQHRLVACRTDRAPDDRTLPPGAAGWESFIPIKHPSVRLDRTRPGADGLPSLVLPHYPPDRFVTLTRSEARQFDLIDGKRPVREIDGSADPAFWQRLYRNDLVWFRAAR
jgi:SAM-dependent methyltransferase